MKRFAPVLAVIAVSAIAGEPTVSTATAPVEKKTVSTGTTLRGSGSGELGTRGSGGLGTLSTKQAKSKPTTTAPTVGTK